MGASGGPSAGVDCMFGPGEALTVAFSTWRGRVSTVGATDAATSGSAGGRSTAASSNSDRGESLKATHDTITRRSKSAREMGSDHEASVVQPLRVTISKPDMASHSADDLSLHGARRRRDHGGECEDGKSQRKQRPTGISRTRLPSPAMHIRGKEWCGRGSGGGEPTTTALWEVVKPTSPRLTAAQVRPSCTTGRRWHTLHAGIDGPHPLGVSACPPPTARAGSRCARA